jgi:ABC-type transport system involved in multi-copper enzyme maturation permease subunit
MRDSLTIMSMDRTAYGLSYMAIQAISIFFTTVVLTFSFMIFYTNPTGSGGEPYIFFFASLLLGLGMLGESMCISTLFEDSKLSTLMGLYVLLLPLTIYLYVVSVVLYVPAKNGDESGNI